MPSFRKFFIVFRKELLFIVRDRKALFANIILTIAITPILFGFIQFVQRMQENQVRDSNFIIGVESSDQNNEFIKIVDSQDKLEIKIVEDKIKELKDGNIQSYIEIEEKEGEEVLTYVYDERSNISAGSIVLIQPLADGYSENKRASILQIYSLTEDDINTVSFVPNTLQKVTGEVTQGGVLLFLLPYIIIIGLIQGSVQYAIEMTAGEKERNTLATTLSLNVSGYTIALAKISTTLLLSLMALVLNASSIIIAFSLFPQEGDNALSITAISIVQILFIMLPLSFLTSSLMILLGIYARNQKEGGIFATPLIFGAVFIGISGAAFDVNTPTAIFLIPLVGHVASLRQILLGSFSLQNNILLFISTFLLFLITVFVTVRMFRREEVLFRQ